MVMGEVYGDQAMSEWRIGACFRYAENPHSMAKTWFRHRIYWHPPVCDAREQHISQDIISAGVYKITGMYATSKWLAVQFEVSDSRGWHSFVCTNVRKWKHWWAAIVDESDAWWES